jgi:hypothetical protein
MGRAFGVMEGAIVERGLQRIRWSNFEGYRGRDAQNRTSPPLPIRTAPDVIGQCPAIKLHQNSAPEQSVRLFLISATLSGTRRYITSGTRLPEP